MVKRFYADNYRCLVNFELKPSPTNLIVGRNGSGKTSVLNGIRAVRDFLLGPQDLKNIFAHSKTLWDSRPKQRFEIEVTGEADESYLYLLEIDHADKGNPRLTREELSSNGGPLFLFNQGQVTLFNDSHQPRGESFDFSSQTSTLTSFVAKGSPMERFHRAIGKILFFSPDPKQMEWSSSAEARALVVNGSNLPSWLRTVSQENPQEFLGLVRSLKDVITAFEQLRFVDLGTAKALQVVFAADKGRFYSSILDLSDGERCLVALYAVLHVYAQAGFTLVFDEPDNFLALDEIGPWLHRVRDAVDDAGLQVIVASHHPDIVDYLAADNTFILSRPSSDLVRLAPFEVNRTSGATASEELRLKLANPVDETL